MQVASQLDRLYGEAKEPVFIKDWEKNRDGSVRRNPTLRRPARGEALDLDRGKDYIWIVDEDGELVVAEEVEVGREGNAVKTLGHPTLVRGKRGRIAGELHFERGRWVLSNKSGRYSMPHKDRGLRQLQNAAALFRKFEIEVECRDVY